MNDNELDDNIWDKLIIRQEIEILGPDLPDINLLKQDLLEGEFDHDVIIVTSRKKTLQRTNIRKLKLGWSIKEKIGMGIVNPRSISKLRKDSGNSNE